MAVHTLHEDMSYLGCVCIPETPQSIMLLRLNFQGHLELVTCLHKTQGLRAAAATHCMDFIEWPCKGVGVGLKMRIRPGEARPACCIMSYASCPWRKCASSSRAPPHLVRACGMRQHSAHSCSEPRLTEGGIPQNIRGCGGGLTTESCLFDLHFASSCSRACSKNMSLQQRY